VNVIVDRRAVRNFAENLTMTCGECGKVADEAVVELGEVPGWDSATAYVCLPCLKRAVAEAEAAVAKDKG